MPQAHDQRLLEELEELVELVHESEAGNHDDCATESALRSSRIALTKAAEAGRGGSKLVLALRSLADQVAHSNSGNHDPAATEIALRTAMETIAAPRQR